MTEMKTRRWMKTVLTEAAICTVQMPWARGARRDEMIARSEAFAENEMPQQVLRRA